VELMTVKRKFVGWREAAVVVCSFPSRKTSANMWVGGGGGFFFFFPPKKKSRGGGGGGGGGGEITVA